MKLFFERHSYDVHFIARREFDKAEAFEERVLELITSKKRFVTVADLGDVGNDGECKLNKNCFAGMFFLKKQNTYSFMITFFFLVHLSDIDKIVASVVKAAHDNDVINNTVIVFLSLPDNSDVSWENNIRRTAFIYSPRLRLHQSISTQLIHVADLLPTLVNASYLRWQTEDIIDGINLWSALNKNEERRTEVYGENFYISNNWKLSYESSDKTISFESHRNENLERTRDVTEGSFEAYVKAVMESDVHKVLNKLDPQTISLLKSRATVHCNIKTAENVFFNENTCNQSHPCLFDLLEDPCEMDNKFGPEFTTRRQHMTEMLDKYLNDDRIGNISSGSFAIDSNESMEDGTVVGIILGATIGLCIFAFIIVVCVKERCNRKRSVYYDKAKEKAEKSAKKESLETTPHNNSASAISHM